jgi:hypothetical protein
VRNLTRSVPDSQAYRDACKAFCDRTPFCGDVLKHILAQYGTRVAVLQQEVAWLREAVRCKGLAQGCGSD